MLVFTLSLVKAEKLSKAPFPPRSSASLSLLKAAVAHLSNTSAAPSKFAVSFSSKRCITGLGWATVPVVLAAAIGVLVLLMIALLPVACATGILVWGKLNTPAS